MLHTLNLGVRRVSLIGASNGAPLVFLRRLVDRANQRERQRRSTNVTTTGIASRVVSVPQSSPSTTSASSSSHIPRELRGAVLLNVAHASFPWSDRRDYSVAKRGGGGREVEESCESATTELNRPTDRPTVVYDVCCFESRRLASHAWS